MSLFKLLPWFNYQCLDNEENYDSFSMTCARISVDNEQQRDNIIIASQSGMITVLRPSSPHDLDENQDQPLQYQACVVCEAKLNEPILRVLCGNFFQYSQRQEYHSANIAILHPRKLVIYSLVTTSGLAEHGEQSRLQILQQYELQKSAFTICKGNFGGVKGKDFLCVMFLDGSLKFFEYDAISQDCVLPGNRTIPTNFIYVSRTDCFIILAPNWDLECYRYLNLSESFERKFSPIWSLNVGEFILDMNSHQVSNSESLIVLLGENNLICVSDTGKMKFIKKLDYTPLSFCSFVVGWYFEPDCKLMSAVATDNGSLLIYQNSTLVWCTELFGETVAISRGNFSGLAGGIVTLDSTGKVNVGYLGSDPQVFKVPPINLSKIDYEKSKRELEEMEKEISSSIDDSDIPYINAAAERDLQVKSELQFDDVDDGEFCKIHFKLMSSINLENVQIHITHNPAFVIPQDTYFVKDLKAYEKNSIEVTIYQSESQVAEIFSDDLAVMISFVNKQSIVRVIKHIIEIPLKRVMKETLPQKDATFKVTFTLSKPINFDGIFPELNISESAQAIGLNTLNAENPTTLIASKNTNKYRIQSNGIAPLLFVLNALTKRLCSHGNTNNNNEQSRTSSKALIVKTVPQSTVDFLLTTIEKQHNMKNEMKKVIESLNIKTNEMRLFERCFLVKMQGKTLSTSMDGIKMLLRDSYNEIIALTNKLKTLRSHIDRIQIQLESTFNLIRKAIEYSDIPQQRVTESLLAIMRPACDFNNQSWMEALSPFVDYIYTIYMTTKTNHNQFYENFTFRTDDFSVSRFSKQLKHILSIIVDSTSDSIVRAEELLAEEPELRDNDNEWISHHHNSMFDGKEISHKFEST